MAENVYMEHRVLSVNAVDGLEALYLDPANVSVRRERLLGLALVEVTEVRESPASEGGTTREIVGRGFRPVVLVEGLPALAGEEDYLGLVWAGSKESEWSVDQREAVAEMRAALGDGEEGGDAEDVGAEVEETESQEGWSEGPAEESTPPKRKPKSRRDRPKKAKLYVEDIEI